MRDVAKFVQGYHFVWKSWKPGNVREFQNGQGKVRENAKNLFKSGKSQGKVREFMWSGKNIKITFFQNTIQQIDALAAVVASLRMQDNAPFSI